MLEKYWQTKKLLVVKIHQSSQELIDDMNFSLYTLFHKKVMLLVLDFLKIFGKF